MTCNWKDLLGPHVRLDGIPAPDDGGRYQIKTATLYSPQGEYHWDRAEEHSLSIWTDVFQVTVTSWECCE